MVGSFMFLTRQGLWGALLARWSEPQRLVMEHLEKACEGFTPAAMADQSFFTSDGPYYTLFASNVDHKMKRSYL